MRFSIRKATFSDANEIAVNWKEMMAFHYPYNPRANVLKKDARARYVRFLKKNMKSTKAAVFVAIAEGKILGHAMVEKKKLPPIYELDTEAYVDELYIRKPYRGKGIGTRLLSECEEWARGMKCDYLGLSSHVKNKNAIGVYRDFGLFEHHFKMIKFLNP